MLYYLIVIFFIIADVLLYYQLKKQIGLNRELSRQKRERKKFEKKRVKLQKERAKRLARETMMKEVLDEATEGNQDAEE